MNNDQSDTDILDALAEEFIERHRQGERPSIAEYEARAPEHADEIRDLFPALAVMEQAASVDESEDVGGQQTLGWDETTKSVESPERIGDYRIIREIGRGGMGVVYEAEQMSLGRYVALKVLPRQLTLGVRERRRFEREAKAAAKLHHTNIVPVFGVGEQDGLHYYVMQFIHGLGLDEVLAELRQIWNEEGASGDLPSTLQVSERRSGEAIPEFTAMYAARTLVSGQLGKTEFGNALAADDDPDATEDGFRRPSAVSEVSETGRLSDTFTLSSASLQLPSSNADTLSKDSSSSQQSYWISVARIGLQTANGLQYAHEQGVLHRDIKPSNLLLDTNGTVWITDFGLAKADDQDNLTNTGDIIGTLRYMAPEMFSGSAEVRSEVYAVGLTLYEMLTLRAAFDEKDRHQLIKQVTSGSPRRVERLNPKIPRDLGIIVNKAIEVDPSHRYQTARELAEDLQRFVNDEPIKARRTSAVERLQRWARHNTAVAASLLTVLFLLVVVAVGSSVAAVTFEGLAKRNADLADEREASRRDAVQSQGEAEAARRKMQIALSDIATSNGLIAAAQASQPDKESDAAVDGDDDFAEAVLWFANAARYGSLDSARERANRIRVQNWLRETILPVRAFPHQSTLTSIEFDATGKYLLAVGPDYYVVRDWLAESSLAWIDGTRKTSAAAWSPDGQRLALAFPPDDAEGPAIVEIRSVPSGDVLQDLKHARPVRSLLFSPDGEKLAVASSSVAFWDCESGTSLAEWVHPNDEQVHSLIFNPQGNQLAAAARDKQVYVLAVPDQESSVSVSTAEVLYPPIRHEPTSPPAFVDGGAGLITATGYSELQWSDAETGKPTRWKRFKTDQQMFTTLLSSPDGRRFSAGGYHSVYEWNIDRDSPLEVQRPHRNHTMDLSYSPDGQKLLTSSWDGRAKLWTRDGKRIGQPLFHQGKVVNTAYSPDGRHIATGQSDGLVRVWALPARVPGDFTMRVDPGEHTARLSPNGQFAFATRFDPFGWPYRTKRLRVFEVTTGKPVGPLLKLAGQVRDATVSPDAKLFATVSRTDDQQRGFLQLWDLHSGLPTISNVKLESDPQAVEFSPDNSLVAVYCLTGPLLIFDVASGEERLRLDHEALRNDMHTRGVRFTPDGGSVIAIGPTAVSVWNVHTGELLFEPIWLGGKVEAAISSDGTFIATGTHVNGLLQVWSLETGELLCDAIPHPDHIFQLRISSDQKLIFTAGRDGQARLWNWQTQQLVCPPLDHSDEVMDVALTPDARWGLTACRDGKVRLWELRTGKLIAPPINSGGRSATSVATIGADRAMLGSLGSSIRSINLGERLVSRDLPLDELCLLAEIVSGQHIHDGNLSRLSSSEWLTRWEQFRSTRR